MTVRNFFVAVGDATIALVTRRRHRIQMGDPCRWCEHSSYTHREHGDGPCRECLCRAFH